MNVDDLTQSLLNQAVAQFHATEQYRLLKEKIDRMHEDCECAFMKDEQDFAEECFLPLEHSARQQECYVYGKGLRDSVCLLKYLGVLA